VLFTYERIKNPEVKSPLFSGWSAIQIEAKDDQTIIFRLPNTLSSFPYSMTNGIVPKHLLESVSPVDLRSASFNTVNPVGTGPFRFTKVEVLGDSIVEKQEKVTLETSDSFYGKKPIIDGITIRTFRDEDSMLTSFNKQEIASMVGLETLRDDAQDQDTVQSFSTPLSGQVLLFLKNSNPILSDTTVRRALLRATDTNALRDRIGYQLIGSDSPFLKSHFSYDPTKIQLPFDRTEAEKLLDQAGWVRNNEGIREKDGQKLSLRLVSQSISEYATVAQLLQEQWGAVGVAVDALLQPEEDVQTGAIIQHDYDVLLYGVSLGPDPDIFAFWHSSQADARLKSRLNLSEYSNKTADLSLEAGRTRTNVELRKLKYTPFLDAWLNDVPAIALYQPRFLFVVRGTLEGYRSGQFTNAADRFYSISDWQIRREKTVK
jgi:peptide/nickel transport system substrate-binding protein